MDIAKKSKNMQIIDIWCERVWKQQDSSAISALFESEGTAGGLGREKLSGPLEFLEFHSAICELLSDTWLRVGDYMEDGNRVACLAEFGGKCRRTGKDISMEGSMFFEFTKNRILHCANHFEFMEFFNQLGLLPEDSFAKALKGESIL